MSSNPRRAQIVAGALGKGCLGGIGLALAFLALSAATYGLLATLGLPYNLVLLLSVASGPILGTALLLVVAYRRAARHGAR